MSRVVFGCLLRWGLWWGWSWNEWSVQGCYCCCQIMGYGDSCKFHYLLGGAVYLFPIVIRRISRVQMLIWDHNMPELLVWTWMKLTQFVSFWNAWFYGVAICHRIILCTHHIMLIGLFWSLNLINFFHILHFAFLFRILYFACGLIINASNGKNS